MRRLLFSVSRFVAMAVLLSVGADIIGDASCAQVISAPSHATFQSGDDSGDGCRTFCVPDCFCCCPAVSGLTAPRIQPTNILIPHRIAVSSRRLDGITSRIFHPPLLRA